MPDTEAEKSIKELFNTDDKGPSNSNKETETIDEQVLAELQQEYCRRILILVGRMTKAKNSLEAVKVILSTEAAMEGIREGLKKAIVESMLNSL